MADWKNLKYSTKNICNFGVGFIINDFFVIDNLKIIIYYIE